MKSPFGESFNPLRAPSPVIITVFTLLEEESYPQASPLFVIVVQFPQNNAGGRRHKEDTKTQLKNLYFRSTRILRVYLNETCKLKYTVRQYFIEYRTKYDTIPFQLVGNNEFLDSNYDF